MILGSFRLNGKSGLLPGCSRGLGAAIALAEAAANVGLHGRSASGEVLCETIRQLGRKSFYTVGEPEDPELCSALVQNTIERSGTIDILRASAGPIPDLNASVFADHSRERTAMREFEQ
jgi:NAD(P)-dependent dehydrogenase (short-subunit alcohol dehydrogenase family)